MYYSLMMINTSEVGPVNANEMLFFVLFLVISAHYYFFIFGEMLTLFIRLQFIVMD